MNAAVESPRAPAISPQLLRFFVGFSRRYVARHFRSLRLATSSVETLAEVPRDRPLVVYLNHSSWWDPLIAMILARHCFPGRPGFAPMESQQLERYGIFHKLGMFGVEQGTARGARDFLRTSEEILARQDAILWLTPQARFADVRERPLGFRAGLAGLARRFPNACFLPLAIEYAPWGERLPEIFVRFGKSETGGALRDHFRAPAELTAHLEQRLMETLDALASDVISRDADRFDALLAGASGVARFYDLWRRLRAAARGEAFYAGHHPSSST